MAEWHAIDKKEALKKLNTTEAGLSFNEAGLRIRKYGRNELRQVSKISPSLVFLQQFKSIFIIILIFAAAFSLFIRHYIDFSAISAIILVNAAIGFFQQYKAEKTISEMKQMLVPRVKVFRDSALVELSSVNLVPGDILQVSDGDKIMADCRIIHENDMEVNEAVLTGESFAQQKSSETLKADTELANRENMLYMGTIVVKGNCRAVVVATGMETEFGKIASMLQYLPQEKTPLEKKLDVFSKKLAVIVLVLAFATIMLGIFRGIDFYEMLLTGIALAISVIPEGIPAIIAITLAIAIKRMHKHNALIRKLPAAETLGRTTIICCDKTGTLTEEEMSVTKIYCRHNYFTIKNHSFYNDRNKKIEPGSIGELRLLLKIGVMCNNARVEKDGKIDYILGDPTEKALILSAEKAGLFKKEETEKEIRLKEYSFSSKRKLMSIVRENGDSVISYVKGAPDVLIKKCTKEFSSGRAIPLTSHRKEELTAAYNEMSSDAFRVIGFAFKEVAKIFNQESAESELVFAGFQGMMDLPRKEVKPAIKECLAAGIKIKMLTGDSLLTAQAVSKMIGLDGASIEEFELQKLSDAEFDNAVREKTIFARITPETKLRVIQSLKKQNEIVAVTGDGVNDVLALKEAHIGVAMGIRGADVARDVSDIVLLDDNFSSIVSAIKEGRRVFDNMKKSIKFNLATNCGELFLVSFALLASLPLPLMPLAILWMNLITDSLPSLSLGFERAEENIMKKKPKDTNETILNGTINFIILTGIISFIAAIILFTAFYQADLEKARTIAVSTLVFTALFITLTCRSENKNIWQIGLFSNKFLVYAVAGSFMLQLAAIYLAPIANIFGFHKLSIQELLLTIAVGSIAFIFFEAQKFVSQRRNWSFDDLKS